MVLLLGSQNTDRQYSDFCSLDALTPKADLKTQNGFYFLKTSGHLTQLSYIPPLEQNNGRQWLLYK